MSTLTTMQTAAAGEAAVPPGKRPVIFVPLRGLSDATALMAVARTIAELEQADIQLVYQTSRHELGHPGGPREALAQMGLTAEKLHGVILDESLEELSTETLRLAEKHAHSTIIMYAYAEEDGDLGELPKKIMERATCPVILVRPEHRLSGRLRHILLPYDGTPATAAVAEPAMQIAELSRAELLVLHVTGAGYTMPEEPGSITPPRYVDQPQHEWPSWFAEFMERAACWPSPPPRVRPLLAVGDVGAEILRVAREQQPSLIILGWHGSWEGEHAQAVKKVLGAAPCPIFVLRVPQAMPTSSASGIAAVTSQADPSQGATIGYSAVILDLDGVITRTATIHARAWKQTFDPFIASRAIESGQPFRPFDSDQDYRRYVDGKPRYDGVRDFLASRGIQLPYGSPNDPPDAETICGLGNRKDALFVSILEQEGGVEVFRDAVEQIHRWRDRGIKIAVVSSSKNCERVLRAAGLLDLFDVRVDGTMAEATGLAGKPAPDTFLEAVRQLETVPSRAIIIEDAAAGVAAGRAGHFALVVGVARGEGHAEALQDAGADLVVDDLRALESRGKSTDTAAADNQESTRAP